MHQPAAGSRRRLLAVVGLAVSVLIGAGAWLDHAMSRLPY